MIRTQNNFDVLRLMFAMWVIITHSYPILGLPEDDVLHQITGGQASLSSTAVQGFFIISGYLITISLVRSQNLFHYLFKRCIRIFPGLWFAVIVSTLVLFSLFELASTGVQESIRYIITNMFLYTHYKIDGVFQGNPMTAINGSLWTIPYEFVSYLLVIPIYFIRDRKVQLASLICLFVSLYTIWFFQIEAILSISILHITASQTIKLFLLFLAGAILSFKQEFIEYARYIAFISFILILASFGLNVYDLSYYLLLPFFILSISYIPIPKIHLLTKYGDFSYGIYLWAFPIQQLLVSIFDLSLYELMIYSSILSYIIGVLSWYIIEKPFLKLKKIL